MSSVFIFNSLLFTVKLVPRHEYETRAKVRRRMADQEQHNAEVRMEIEDLKSGMPKLTEMLQVLIARGEPPQRTVIQEAADDVEDPIPIQRPATTWPEFGLPPNYSPPHATAAMVGQSSRPIFQTPIMTESQPIVHVDRQTTYENPLFEYQAGDID